MARRSRDRLPRGSQLGKYRIVAPLGVGGFARVYRAHDMVEGRDVALKVPHEHVLRDGLDELLREVRITLKLDHPNILDIRNATFVGNQLVIAYPLGERSLHDRLKLRMASKTAATIAGQLVDAIGYAHSQRVIHCDISPHNVIVFQDNEVKLTDFGIAKVTARTKIIDGSGSGTVGYIAPEQAMGQPSFRSDVFSLGLLIYRMFSGQLPRWPFAWPPPGYDRVKRKLRPEAIKFLRRAIEVDERKRFRNGRHMKTAFDKSWKRALRA